MGLMSQELVVSAFGEDRPGIVAAVTGVLLDHGCNLLDTSMTILRGRFVMMLVVTGPQDIEGLAAELDRATVPLGVACQVTPAPAAARAEAEGEPYVLSVYGTDRPGIVARIAGHLAEQEVNITDLSTRLIGEADRPVFAMVLDLVLPGGLDADDLAAGLDRIGGELGVHCRLHPGGADVL
jgi:glycine cleavage system transcriptional repressor